MESDITKLKEEYIEQATRIAIGENIEPSEVARSRSIKFWQSLTDEDRFNATAEIVRRVHIAQGGNPDDLRVNRSVTRLAKTKN